MNLQQLTNWFYIDAMWARDFNNELNQIGRNTSLISSGLGLFEYIATRAIYGIQKENTLDAAIGNLLLYEDIMYMKDISSLYNFDLSKELNYMETVRQNTWTNTVLLPKSIPNMIQELPYNENEEVKVYNADVRWTNDFVSRSLSVGLFYPGESLSMVNSGLIMWAATIEVFSIYRQSLLNRDERGAAFINALEKSDGLWWKKIHNLTNWTNVGLVANTFLKSSLF